MFSNSLLKIRTFAIILFAVASALFFLKYIHDGIQSIPGYDFRLRYHEVECIRRGIDPYDIVTKKLPSDEFALFATPEALPGVKTLHVYTPWEYTYFLPFSLLSEKASGALFLGLSVLALVGISVYAYCLVQKYNGNVLDGIFAASAVLLLGNAAGELFAVANYGALNAVMILLMVWALTAKHDVLAGIAWAFLMTKPQIGLLFAIPLLLRKRFVVIGVAVSICLLCMIPPALMCGRNPLVMLLEVPRGCAFVAADNGTMLIPSQVFRALSGRVDPGVLGLLSMMVGAGICLYLTWRMRGQTDWLIILSPIVVCALLWSYCKPHDRVILWVTQLLLALFALRTDKPYARWFCFLMLLLTAWPFLPDDGSLVKLLRRVSLACLLVFCWWMPRLSFHKVPQDIPGELGGS